MKMCRAGMKTCCLVMLFALAAPGAGASIVEDGFNDGVLDLGLWDPSYAFGNSSLVESGGVLTFGNKGRLTAVSSFTDSDITGRFRINDAADILSIALRFDNTWDPTYGSQASGVIVRIGYRSPTPEAWVNENGVKTAAPIALVPGQYHDFRVRDSGGVISVYFDDLVNPILNVNVVKDDGDRIALYNREVTNVAHYMNLDYIRIVPEPASVALLGLGSLAVILSRRRR